MIETCREGEEVVRKAGAYLACRDGELFKTHHVLNECLLDRGSSPSLANLECYIDGNHITTVQVDSLPKIMLLESVSSS